MALEEVRRGQIAHALVKWQMRREGFKLSSGTGYELGAMAVETGIPISELEEFMLELLPELLGDAFGFEHVSLNPHGRRGAPPQPRVVSTSSRVELIRKMNS